MSRDGCLLDRSDISLVSENDHRVGQCLCKFCTCGRHQCPSSSSRRNYASQLSYSTSYRNSFQRKTPAAVARPEQLQYSPNLKKMDLQTTHMREFKSFTIEKSPEERVRTSTPILKFTSSSSYAADFPNWGSVESNVEKRPQLPVRTEEVKFLGRSSYQANFKEPELRTLTPGRGGIRPRTSTMAMGTAVDGTGLTTNQMSYRPFRSDQLGTVVKRPLEDYTKLAVSPLHYLSINKADYQPRTHSFKDPRLIRKQILAHHT